MLARSLKQYSARTIGANVLMNSSASSSNSSKQMVRSFASRADGPLYNYVFKSNITYVTFVLTGAFVCGALYNTVGDWVWEVSNKGVSLFLFFSCC